MKDKYSIHPSWLHRDYVYEENDMSCQENAALLENYFEQFFEELIKDGVPELVAEKLAEQQAKKRMEEQD